MAANSILANMSVIIDAKTAALTKSLDQSSRQLQKFSGNIANIGKTLIAGFGLIEIGRGVIDVTSQFEKFEAVLTNTLGDSSKAQKALKDIREFAQTTPFEVGEVTAAYVRWANQGLTPTIAKMKKLGDVASSLGAGFEQTAEAFKDLAVGQTKRLEEIGISAEAIRGTNMLRLAFKGVTLEIEKNAAGVEKALDIYSQLNGVLGTSDAVSKTLGGRISNLKDAWDGLLLTIGSGSGILGQAVESLTMIVTALANLGKDAALIGQAISPFHDLRDLSKETLDYLIKTGRTDLGNKLSKVLEPFSKQSSVDFLKNLDQNRQDFIYTLDKEGESIEDIVVLWDHYVQKRLEAAQAQREEEKAARLSEILKLKELAIEKAKTKELERQQQIKQGGGGFANRQNNLSDSKIPVLSLDTSPLINAGLELDKLAVKIEEFNPDTSQLKQVGADIKESLDIGPAVAGLVTDLAESLGGALAGTEDFGKAILRAMASFAQTLGGMMIATGIAKIAFDKFKGPAMVAAGIALVAAASATKLTMNARPNLSNGGGGGSSSLARSATQSSGGGMTTAQDSGPALGTVTIRGEDLFVVFQQYERNNKKTKVGG
jgi:hypothetical protein